MRHIEQLQRVYRRSGSLGNFVTAAKEELFVRAWSSAKVRRISGPFVSGNYNPGRWVFLVGCYNSGTTILQKILNAHPEIAGLPREGVRFTQILSNLEEHGHHMIWADDFRDFIEPDFPDDVAFNQIKKDWAVFWKNDRKAFLDKSIANTARISWLNRVFPNAFFIGIHRNGYCVSEGLQRRATPPGWLVDKTGNSRYPLETIANQWVCANEMMLDQFSGLPNSMLVGFEDFIADPVDTLVKAFEQLGVDSGSVSFNSGKLIIHGKEFILHDPNPASLQRFDDSSKAVVAPLLRSTMLKLGYEGAV